MYGSRGCLGCCSNKSPPITRVDQPSKGLKIQGQSVKKLNKSNQNNNLLEDFWSTTSTYEMENNSAMQSQRSVSSLSAINAPPGDPNGSGSTSNNNNSEFVNHGLLLWNQTRQQWLANKQPTKSQQIKEPKLSWNATYESLLGTNKPFPHPIPLSEMVDFLVDVWEQEGMYD